MSVYESSMVSLVICSIKLVKPKDFQRSWLPQICHSFTKPKSIPNDVHVDQLNNKNKYNDRSFDISLVK